MPDIRQTLRHYAKVHGVRLDIVEKDYALSYLLAAIAGTPALGDRIALKGGTALKKVYYPDYRFSEDLDYSTLASGPLKSLPEAMDAAVQRMAALLQVRGPFEIRHSPLVLKRPHPGGQAAFVVRVRFPGQRQPLCRLKVEITVDEDVLMPPKALPLLHGFGEKLDVTVNAYTLTEIVAEKLRALLQSRQRLAERGWGASRVCRDYYDIWEILNRESPSVLAVTDILQRKCSLRGVGFQSSRDFLTPALEEVARREWTQQLLPFVPQAPPAERVLADLEVLLPALLGE